MNKPNSTITENINPLGRSSSKMSKHFFPEPVLSIQNSPSTKGFKKQKIFAGAFFFSLIAYCLSTFLWAGFNFDEVKNLETPSPEIATLDAINPDLFEVAISIAKVTSEESIEISLIDENSESATPKDAEEWAEDSFASELLAGQGGYDLSASIANYSLVNAGPPTPQVWAKQIQAAGVYPELTYMSYRIREGDMIGIIAERFDVSQDTLISVNNIRQTRLIQINEYIRVPSMSGVLYTTKADDETPFSIAEKYQVSAKKTASINDFEENTLLEAGVTVFVPDAFLDWVTRQEINGDLFLRPLRSRYYISSNYGWRNSPFTGARSFHTGIDMAAPKWTPIYGTLAGRVTTAKKLDRIYGNYVIVTHHSGYSTLYGHMEALNVSVGQTVSTNSILGWVGSTGLSTGNHVHFSVFKYGKSVNPVSLWH